MLCNLIAYGLNIPSSNAGNRNRITAEISGPGLFENRLEAENTCWRVSTVRLFIQRSNDDLVDDSFRWWSNPEAIILKEGEHTMEVPLTPDHWSNVAGKKGDTLPKQFYAALENAGNIGMTFGGGCFFGHGVNVSGGHSTFTLKRFAINR